MSFGLPSAPSALESQDVVVLCGNILPDQKLVAEPGSKLTNLSVVGCTEDHAAVFSLLRQRRASLFVARQAFIEGLVEGNFAEMRCLFKGVPILVVLESDKLESPSSLRLLRLGCRGILPREFTPKLASRAVLAVLQGELWAPRRLISELLTELLPASSLKAESGLTPQEARIQELSSQGYKNADIADALFISIETVRWHKRRLNRKLRASESRYPHTQVSALPRRTASG